MQSLKLSETCLDAEMIRNIEDGKTGLFKILIRRNNPFLYKVGMSYGFSHQDVEDLMQETFLAVLLSNG